LGAEQTARGPAVRLGTLGSGRLNLLVVGEGTSTSHPLPESGEVTLGRGDNADIRIDDPSISRRHAKLHIGAKLMIEDLGSANGTCVRSVPLKPGQKVEILPGVAIELGSTVVIVQGPNPASQRESTRSRSQSVRPRRLGTHGYFEVRLEEACTQAEADGGRFAVLRVHLDDAEKDDGAPEILVQSLRQTDLVAAYGPGEYEALLVDAEPDEAQKAIQQIQAAFDKEQIKIRTGVACYPEDGRTPETLVERACALAQGLQQGGDRQIVIQDRVMVRLHRLIERVAQGNISVLLLGETGVGKEVLAEAVHRASPRGERPFVKINCAALTETLFESELFGHERGAFTGAVKTKLGLLEAAHGGTMFLDEVGEMPHSIQAKLLRVIEERKVLRVGGLSPKEVDVRFVSATNRNLEEEVARGRFRQDLFYRLNGIALVVPPLRERVSEIDGLARVFITHASKALGGKIEPRLSDEALTLLRSYSWPGNIRELRNVIERAVLLCLDDEITPEHLPVEKMGGSILEPKMFGVVPNPGFADPEMDRGHAFSMHIPGDPTIPPTRGAREEEEVGFGNEDTDDYAPHTGRIRRGPQEAASPWEIERQRIIEALDRCAGNQSQAAKLLGISRRTLVSRLVTYRIPRPRKPLPDEP
jgi:two-component system, NtrC family, response regulator AtoC